MGLDEFAICQGKILWIQQTVLSGTNCIGQVPTLLKYSDVGDKVFATWKVVLPLT